jgi:hypothetical protein
MLLPVPSVSNCEDLNRWNEHEQLVKATIGLMSINTQQNFHLHFANHGYGLDVENKIRWSSRLYTSFLYLPVLLSKQK